MEVILREDVTHLGKAGEVVSVKNGYARNFLIPRGLAYHATDSNKRRIDVEKQRRETQVATQRAEASGVADRLAAVSLTFNVRTGEGDKLFGSITAADIAEKLREQGLSVDKRRIDLDEPIKMVGIYKVPVRLEAGVVGEVRVWVVKE
jgi:large subunit ribosomal protein L9